MSKTKKVAEAIEELCDMTDELIEKLEKLVVACNEIGVGYEIAPEFLNPVIEAEKVLKKARGEE